MRENEFEKRVQQKMGDFNLRPSADVWTEVERRIRKEKKRRFIVWWPLFFLLAAGGIATGIFLTNKKGKDETIVAGSKKTNTPTQSSLEKTMIPETVNNSNSINNTDIDISKNTTVIVKDNSDEIKITPDKTVINLKPIKQKNATGMTTVEKMTNNKQGNNNDIVTTDKKVSSQNEQPLIANTVPSKKNEPLALVTDSATTTVIAIESNQETPQMNHQPVPVANIPDNTNEQRTKPTDIKTKKWDWGLNFSIGRSSIGNGFSFAQKSLYAEALTLQSPPSSLFSYSSSWVRPSFSWAAGVYFKKAVSKKLDFNVGLGYSFLSTKINVGSKVDSARLVNNFYSRNLTVGNFYRQGNSSYTNGFHFISLSSNLSWRIIPGKRINIYWENELRYNRMLGSNMLHYDRNLQGYYKDNSFLVKNQLAFSTGFSIPVSKRIQVNPFVSYNLTPVLKNSDTLHFTNYGIRIRFLMNKK